GDEPSPSSLFVTEFPIGDPSLYPCTVLFEVLDAVKIPVLLGTEPRLTDASSLNRVLKLPPEVLGVSQYLPPAISGAIIASSAVAPAITAAVRETDPS